MAIELRPMTSVITSNSAIAELIAESERNASEQLTHLLRKELESLRLVAARSER